MAVTENASLYTVAVNPEIAGENAAKLMRKWTVMCPQGKRTAVRTDRTALRLVTHRTTDQAVTITLTNDIVDFVFSRCGEFLAVADVAGVLHLFKTESARELFAYPIVAPSAVASDAIEAVAFATTMKNVRGTEMPEDLLVLTKAGVLIRLGNLYLPEIEQTLARETSHNMALRTIMTSIQLQQVNVGRRQEGAKSILLGCRYLSSLFVIVGNHEDALSVWRVDTSGRQKDASLKRQAAHTALTDGTNVMDVQFALNGRCVAVLSEAGFLTWWDWRGMFVLHQMAISSIKAFVALDNHSGDVSCTVALHCNVEGESATIIQLVQVEHLSSSRISDIVSTHSVPVPTVATVVSIATLHEEPSLVITHVGNDTVGVSAVNLHSVDDEMDQAVTTPEDPSAISPGLCCGLELRALELSSLKDAYAVSSLEEKLRGWLNCIGQDLEDSRIMVENLVEFAKRLRLAQSSQNDLPPALVEHLPVWLDQIASSSYRWTTFTLLLSTSISNDANAQSLTTRWREFCKANLLDVMCFYLEHGMMRAVSLLWQRHTHHEALQRIETILDAVPQDLPFIAYESWLRGDVVPGIIKHVEHQSKLPSSSAAEVINSFARWTVKRIEYFADKGDVDTALKLCCLMKPNDDSSGSLSTEASMRWVSLRLLASTAPASVEENTHESPLASIERLSRELADVKYLESWHNFKISLAVYAQESPVTIAMSMLDRCTSAEMVSVEVQQHIVPYLLHCGRGKDPVLLDYVTEALESAPTTSGTAEQAKLIAIIDEITDVEIRASAALLFFGSLLPPFSTHVKQFTRKCITWDTRQIDVIQEHVRLMDIQDMLTGYGVVRFQVGDPRGGSRLVSHILAQIARESAFADALQLVSAYSHLSAERAALEYFENILTIETPSYGLSVEGVASRRSSLMKSAVKQLKVHFASVGISWRIVSVLEETAALGLSLLELKEAEQETKSSRQPSRTASAALLGDDLFLRTLEESLEMFITEIDGIEGPSETHENWGRSDSDLLNTKLLSDIQRIRRVHSEWGVVVSVATVRDPERVSERVRAFIEPASMFSVPKPDQVAPKSLGSFPLGKGKKRALGASNASVAGGATKKARSLATSGLTVNGNDDQQDDRQTKLAFDVHRYATHMGMAGDDFQSLVAQAAAEHGDIIRAVHYSRDLFSRRRGITSVRAEQESTHVAISASALALKNISLSISTYTATHTEEIYSLATQGRGHERQTLTPIQLARMQAPLYSLELLRYAICVCDGSSFEEILLLLKSAMLMNDILKFTQLGSIFDKERLENNQRVYDRWFREDTLCVLPSAQMMNLATRFAIAEHRLLVTHGNTVPIGVIDQTVPITSHDLLASKRFVSFLVENNADLLSLQVILSMHWIPEDALSVIQSQVSKLISTVFQSRDIDNFLALGLMLTMDQRDAFNAFRRQISRENVAKDFNRFQQLAKIGSDSARAWQQIAFLNQCLELEGNARWWHFLNLLEIECDHKAFQSERRDLDYIRSLVPTLLTKTSYDYYTIQEFTRHYQIEDSFPALVYVEALLTVPEATAKSLEYQDKIVGVLEDIHEQRLVTLLLKTLPKVSGTDYDRLLFMFQLLLEHTSYGDKEEVERRIEVLNVLKAYASSNQGLQGNMDVSSGENNADAIGPDDNESVMKRTKSVCFHRMMTKPSEVLSEILTTRSFTILSNLDYPLRLEPDELLMLLLKNVVGRQRAEASKHQVHDHQKTPFLSGSELERLFAILNSLKAVESKITAGEWLAEHLPVSSHKLRSLEFALETAAASSRESAMNRRVTAGNKTFMGIEALTRLEEKVLRSKVQLILSESTVKDIVNPICESNVLKLIMKLPKEAFYELYRSAHSSVTPGSTMTTGQDELHKVADRIAGVLNLKANELRIDLIRELLVKEVVYTAQQNRRESIRGQERGHEEIIFSPIESEERDSRDELFVNKISSLAVFVASESQTTSDAIALIEYLVTFARDKKPRAGVTFRAKLRAARVILHLAQSHRSVVIAAVEAHMKLAKFDAVIKELVDYIRHCKHMIVFEENRVPYEIGFVMRANKEALVRSLLRQHSGREPWVLRCVANLMLDFDVQAPDLWEFTLTTMREQKMFRSLSRVLNGLSQQDFVRSINGASEIWEDTMLSPLLHLKSLCKEASSSLMESDSFGVRPEQVPVAEATATEFHGILLERVRSELDLMVGMLQRCPFLEQIDVASFVVHLRDIHVNNTTSTLSGIDLFAYAVRCAIVIPRPSARIQALQRIIQSGAYKQVLTIVSDASVLSEEALDKNVGDSKARMFSDHVSEQLAILETIFNEVLKRNEHENLLGSPFEDGFLEFLALSGCIDRALATMLAQKRLEAASTLVELYYESNPERAPPGWAIAEAPHSDTDSNGGRWRTLQQYVASSTSSDLAMYRDMTS